MRLAADRVRIVRVHEVSVDALVSRMVGRVRHLLKFAAFYPLLCIVLPILLAHGRHARVEAGGVANRGTHYRLIRRTLNYL